jgi:hypothetical protein
MKELPEPKDLNEFNYVLITIASSSEQLKSCSANLVIDTCSLVVYGGQPVNYKRILSLCSYAGLISYKKGHVKLTELGILFLSKNPTGTYEITNEQKRFISENLILSGPWMSRARDIFLNFVPNYKKVTFEFDSVNNPLPKRFNAILYLLMTLSVIEDLKGLYTVTPNYVSKVVSLRAEIEIKTEEQLIEMLEANRKLSDHAEDSVVEYERSRLIKLGRNAEADLVRKISKLNVSAGYDIESFDGDKPQLEYNRFIEVKASQNKEIRFFWTYNELKTAEKLGDRYWIYFIGNFTQSDHNLPSPIMIRNPALRINHIHELKVDISQYLISQIEELMLTPIEIENVKGYLL